MRRNKQLATAATGIDQSILRSLVNAGIFFKPCRPCSAIRHHSRDTKITFFDLDDVDGPGYCHYCQPNAPVGHRVVKIRRNTYCDVIRASDLAELYDIEAIQQYSTNDHKVVFLGPRTGHVQLTGDEHPDRTCVTCHRLLREDGMRYCSLQCKLDVTCPLDGRAHQTSAKPSKPRPRPRSRSASPSPAPATAIATSATTTRRVNLKAATASKADATYADAPKIPKAPAAVAAAATAPRAPATAAGKPPKPIGLFVPSGPRNQYHAAGKITNNNGSSSHAPSTTPTIFPPFPTKPRTGTAAATAAAATGAAQLQPSPWTQAVNQTGLLRPVIRRESSTTSTATAAAMEGATAAAASKGNAGYPGLFGTAAWNLPALQPAHHPQVHDGFLSPDTDDRPAVPSRKRALGFLPHLGLMLAAKASDAGAEPMTGHGLWDSQCDALQTEPFQPGAHNPAAETLHLMSQSGAGHDDTVSHSGSDASDAFAALDPTEQHQQATEEVVSRRVRARKNAEPRRSPWCDY